MTNKPDVEDFGETEREALKSMAVKIIKKVLDEAQSIAFAVKNSGEPDLYENNHKYEDLVTLNTDENNMLNSENNYKVSEDIFITNVAGSTDPKTLDSIPNIIDYERKVQFIGQGDATATMEQIYSSNRDSMSSFIIISLNNVSEDENFKTENNFKTLSKLMESYVDEVLEGVYKINLQTSQKAEDKISLIVDSSIRPNLSEVLVPKIENNNYENKKEDSEAIKPHKELYEQTFLSLNRDEEQDSEKDVSVKIHLEDSFVPFHEIQLSASQEIVDVKTNQKIKNKTISKRSCNTLVRHCRARGSRFLACLRKWWRRETSNKQRYKVCTTPGTNPSRHLSPIATRHTINQIGQGLSSKSTKKCFPWKFNTLNKIIGHPTCHKEYTFEINSDLMNY